MQQHQGSPYLGIKVVSTWCMHRNKHHSVDHLPVPSEAFIRRILAEAFCAIEDLPHLQDTNWSLGRPSIFVTAALS